MTTLPPKPSVSSAQDLFSLYFQYVQETESPTQFHRWSLIAGIGAVLGRNFYLPHGTTRIFPNSYVMLVGNPGTRKSSAIKGVKKLIARAGYEHFSAEKTTKEKFLLDLEGLPENYGDNAYNYEGSKNGTGRGKRGGRSEQTTPEDVLRNLTFGDDGDTADRVPREVFVCADEFNEFTGSGNIDFFSLLGALWDWDDDSSSYRYRLKNSKSLSIYQPTISILGGNTHTGIQTAFPAEAVGQGFMSRLLFIHGEPSGRKIAFPKKPPEELADRIVSFISEIRGAVSGEAKLTSSAENALQTIYLTWTEIDDYRFKYYSTRRFTHLIKLVLICAAMRKSTLIDVPDVLLANTLLTHAEHGMPKALGEFGKSKNSDAAQAIMSKLFESKVPVSIPDLWKVVGRDLDRKEQLSDILNNLQSTDKIQYIKEGKGGFLPKQKPVSGRAVYVDLSLLKNEWNGY